MEYFVEVIADFLPFKEMYDFKGNGLRFEALYRQ